MNKEELVYYVESLGFKRNHKDKYFINPQDKEFYLFDGKDDVIVEVIKVMDYYTSYWGNHPYHEEIRIYMKSSVTAHQELYSAKLSVMDFYAKVFVHIIGFLVVGGGDRLCVQSLCVQSSFGY